MDSTPSMRAWYGENVSGYSLPSRWMTTSEPYSRRMTSGDCGLDFDPLSLSKESSAP